MDHADWPTINWDRVLMPPVYRKLPKDAKLVFLNGPIQQAPDWHQPFILGIQHANQAAFVACPKRLCDLNNFVYEEQVHWEWYHQRSAAVNSGVNVFWMANKVADDPKRAYAQTTRVEMGYIHMWRRLIGCKMVVGVDSDYSGAKYARMLISERCPGVLICATLEETVDAALEQLERRQAWHCILRAKLLKSRL